MGGPEYQEGRGPHIHVAIQTSLRWTGDTLHGWFGGFWSNNDESDWDDMLEYIGKEGGIGEFWNAHTEPRGGHGHSAPRARDLGPYHATAGRGSDYIDGGASESGRDVGSDGTAGLRDIIPEPGPDSSLGDLPDIGIVDAPTEGSGVVESDTQQLLSYLKTVGFIQSQAEAIDIGPSENVQGNPNYWDLESKVKAKRILTVQGQKGRNAKEPNGVFREIAELMLKTPT